MNSHGFLKKYSTTQRSATISINCIVTLKNKVHYMKVYIAGITGLTDHLCIGMCLRSLNYQVFIKNKC